MTAPSVTKVLSSNDVGATGGHQAGIHVPKDREVLSFFPALRDDVKNPRVTLVLRETGDNTRWSFQYIYYNNKFFGGTRNEYRLTGMTAYLRAVSARAGDILEFSKDDDGSFFLNRVRREEEGYPRSDTSILVLRGGWKVVNL